MAKTRQQKQKEVEALLEKLQQSKSGALVSYEKLNVADLTNLRKELREAGVSLTMIKKRLLKIVLEKAGLDPNQLDLADKNVSLALSSNDEVAPAKILAKFAKEHESLELQGGILESQIIDKNQIKALANIPSREELLAKMVGSLKSPISGLVGSLSGNLRNLVYTLNAIKEAKS